MKTMTIMTFFVLTIGISATATACGSHGKTDKADHNMDMSADHGDHGHQQQTAAVNKNGFKGMPSPGTKAVCPVMKNEFTVTKNSPYSIYKGKTYVFCCPSCKPAFEKETEKYIKK